MIVPARYALFDRSTATPTPLLKVMSPRYVEKTRAPAELSFANTLWDVVALAELGYAFISGKWVEWSRRQPHGAHGIYSDTGELIAPASA